MNRTLRTTFFVLVAAAASAAPAAEEAAIGHCGGSWGPIFKHSHDAKKGVKLFVNGEQIGGLVVGCTPNTVELKSQEYGRIVVALERIDAVAIP